MAYLFLKKDPCSRFVYNLCLIFYPLCNNSIQNTLKGVSKFSVHKFCCGNSVWKGKEKIGCVFSIIFLYFNSLSFFELNWLNLKGLFDLIDKRWNLRAFVAQTNKQVLGPIRDFETFLTQCFEIAILLRNILTVNKMGRLYFHYEDTFYKSALKEVEDTCLVPKVPNQC